MSKANDDDYFLNYLNDEEEVEDYEATYSSNVNLIRNRNVAATATATATANANAPVESSFEDCYIEDTTLENNSQSLDDSDSVANPVDSGRDESNNLDPVLPPPSYSRRMAAVEDSDDSIEDVDNTNDKQKDNYDDLDDEDSDDIEEENKLTEVRSAAGGSYLSMDAAGNVVRSFSFLRRVDLSQSEDEDNKSTTSAPRTSLPEGTNAAPSLLNTSIEEEPESSFLLPPPNAEDYAAAEVSIAALEDKENNNNNNNNLIVDAVLVLVIAVLLADKFGMISF
mmetsp:Transcript_8792/g.21697  ORF Transcript_8792/g.21697 Transcript_8792/m.21697 type:complete len:281 (-) Transcript_8792:103-945(-)